MKTDERMADKISHMEGDIKVLKNEVQAVLVDLRDKYLEAENLFNASSNPATTQQVVVLQTPGANEARSDTGSNSGSAEKDVRDKKQAPAGGSEAGRDTRPEAVKKEVMDKKQEPAGGSEAGRGTRPETAREKVIESQTPEEVTTTNTRPKKEHIPDREITLISVVGLVNWAEESVKKVGHQKTEAILDVAEMMGLLSPQLKQIMTKLINIDVDGKSQSVSARALLNSLVKVTTLLGKDNQTEAALLSILSGEDDLGANHHTPW